MSGNAYPRRWAVINDIGSGWGGEDHFAAACCGPSDEVAGPGPAGVRKDSALPAGTLLPTRAVPHCADPGRCRVSSGGGEPATCWPGKVGWYKEYHVWAG
jgi:hypothetical protein